MRPRQEIVALDTKATMAQCLDVAEKTRFSRFPLCADGDLDRTLGVVHIKDLYAMRIKAHTGAELLPAAKKLIYVPETARLERLLQWLLERRLHLAVVVDEYGVTVGLVSLENIIEELVGQIQDEFDQEKPLLTRASDTSWEVAGALPLHDLAELVGVPLREEDITTTSGWVTHRLGGFPKVGDVVRVGNCELRVEELEARAWRGCASPGKPGRVRPPERRPPSNQPQANRTPRARSAASPRRGPADPQRPEGAPGLWRGAGLPTTTPGCGGWPTDSGAASAPLDFLTPFGGTPALRHCVPVSPLRVRRNAPRIKYSTGMMIAAKARSTTAFSIFVRARTAPMTHTAKLPMAIQAAPSESFAPALSPSINAVSTSTGRTIPNQ